ncbi:Bromodomain and PHD finger-containing protein 3 [Linum perenne]
MGKVAAKAEAMTKKRKKKGRPSLLDLQKRAIKQELQQQQQQQRHTLKNNNLHQTPLRQNPNSLNSSARRSARRNPLSDEEEGHDEEDDDDERKEKKLKPLLGLNSREQGSKSNPLIRSNSSASNSHGSGSNADADNPEAADVKNRQIGGGEKLWKATDTLHGLSGEAGPTTPLPDKKLLLFILDRLQKKDTYGVFSDPVDPEELPDYHDIIEHPMDFSTVRRKLDGAQYLNLEQFEKDVFLICSNAMQYNPPDTVYFRQARSIQELAKKDFENLRQDSDDGDDEDDGEPEPKVERVVRRGRPPGKMKKSLEKSPFDRAVVEFNSDATLATGGDNSNGSNGYNFRRTTLFKPPVDTLGKNSHGSHNGETYASWLSEWENEFPASVLKAVMKHVKKPATLDENRRDSYDPPVASTSESFVLNPFEGELKQLVAVGLNAEYGYARSVARFAADLGPTAWRMASKRIQRVLPMGVEFGPGWVGENDVVQGSHVLSSNDKNPSGNSAPSDPSSSHQPSTSTVNSHHTQNIEDTVKGVSGSSSQGGLTSLKDNLNGMNAVPSASGQQHIRSGGLPPLGGTPHRPFGLVPSPNASFGPTQQVQQENVSRGNQTIVANNMGIGGRAVSHGPSPYHKHQQESIPFPTDLNVGFLSPSSPSSSGVPTIGSPQQPDLALQL